VTVAVGPDDRAGGVLHPPRSVLAGSGRVAALLTGLAVAGCLLLILLRIGKDSPASLGPGSYDNRQLPLVTVASLGANGEPPTPITPSTLRPDKATALRSKSGADVNVANAAVFGVTAADSGTLYAGSVQAKLAEPDANFSVTAANLRIVDKGTAFSVERIDADHVAVTVLDGEVEVQSRVRMPVCYWPFDDAPAEVVGIRGGTGEKVGTGLLAMAEGITLEAMIVSAWSGRFGDYDEIYRKEDGDARVLLSFQNDGRTHERFSEPAVHPGPCLSFGLHLAGCGYRELDMPLDGVDGRPRSATHAAASRSKA